MVAQLQQGESMRIQASVLAGVGATFDVREVDLAGPLEGEILVRIAATGLCASDVNAIDGKRTLVPFPAVVGHEAAGVVEAVGPGVVDIVVGDHVVLSIVPYCGACDFCERGIPNFCATAGSAMAAGALFDGTRRLSSRGAALHHFLTVSSFAEYAVVPASGAVKIDPTMPLDRAALLSCAVLTGYGAVRRTAGVEPGARVAVFGCGGIGLNSIQGARIAGATTIVAVDVSEEKLELARLMGATHVINSRTASAPDVIRELTGGADYVFESSGVPEVVTDAWRSVGPRGELILVGLFRQGTVLPIDAGPFVNEQTIRGCYFGSSDIREDIPELVRLYLAGELLLDELISHRIGLSDLDEAVGRLRRGEGARSVVVFEEALA
jgi:S-(hydroxymethyl)glutathione dehydrogenase/alcohol dehydrogenase